MTATTTGRTRFPPEGWRCAGQRLWTDAEGGTLEGLWRHFLALDPGPRGSGCGCELCSFRRLFAGLRAVERRAAVGPSPQA